MEKIHHVGGKKKRSPILVGPVTVSREPFRDGENVRKWVKKKGFGGKIEGIGPFD